MDHVGNTVRAASWSTTEQFKIQVPDQFARDHLGQDVALSRSCLLASAPGHDLFGENVGALYLHATSTFGVSFQQVRQFDVCVGMRLSVSARVNMSP